MPQLFIRLILILSLIATSLPAMPVNGFTRPSHPYPVFTQQALAAPAISAIHHHAKRVVTASVNTIKLFRELPFDKPGIVGALLAVVSMAYAASAHAATVGAHVVVKVGSGLVDMSHTVIGGETLTAIGRQTHLPWKAIYDLNRDVIGSNANVILPGMNLYIPPVPRLEPFVFTPPAPPMPSMSVEGFSFFHWIAHIPAEAWIVAALVTAFLSLIWMYRRVVFKNFPAILAFSAVLGSSVFSMGQLGTPKPLVSQTADVTPIAQAIPSNQTFTNIFYVTPESPRYQLHMAEKGTVKLIRPTGVEITRDSALYEAEENAAQREVQEFEIANERINRLFPAGLISETEKLKQDTGRAIAKEKLMRARDAITSRLSVPFPGKIWQFWNVTAEGAPYLEVSDSRVAVVTLFKPQAFLASGAPAVDVIPLMKRGFPVTLSKEGKTIPYSHFSLEGDTLKFFVSSSQAPGNITVSIQVPPALHEEPAYPVRYRFTYDVVAPQDGIVKDFRFLQQGSRLPAGPAHFFKYDTTWIESYLRELKAQRDYLKTMVAHAKALAAAKVESADAYVRLQNDLAHAEQAIIIAEKQKAETENPMIQMPWDSVVVRQSLWANGQRVKKNDPLMTLASRHQFETVLLIDPESASRLKVGDTRSVVLEGTQDHFPAQIHAINSATGPNGDQKIGVTLYIQDDKGILREGFCVQFERPSSGLIEKIRSSTEYDWVRNVLDKVSKGPTLSQEERTQIFKGVVEDPNTPALYKEWALIRLANMGMGKIDVLFHFVQKNVDDRRLRSFAEKLLHTLLYEGSLYNVSALSNEHAQIDGYLASWIPRDPRAVELQMQLSQNSNRVLSRWRGVPGLDRIVWEEDSRRRGLIYIQQSPAPDLIDPNSSMHTLQPGVNVFRLDQFAINQYLTHGHNAQQTLVTIAPAFTAAIHTPSPPLEKTQEAVHPEPSEPSNNAIYFTSPMHYEGDLQKAVREIEQSSQGDKTLPGTETFLIELAEKNALVLRHVAQEQILRNDLPGLVHLFNSLSLKSQNLLLSDIASSGRLSSALYHETVTWDTPVDTVWAEFFRDFYRAALTNVNVKNPSIRNSLIHALIKTYQTTIELAQAVCANTDAADLKGLSEKEAAQYHRIAQHYFLYQVASEVLLERADVLKQKADQAFSSGKKQKLRADGVDSISAARLASEWDDSGSGQEDTSQLQELLAKEGVSFPEVEQRMRHYESAFQPSGTKLWVDPQPFNKRILVSALALLGAVLGFVLWKPNLLKSKTSSRSPADSLAPEDSKVQPSQSVLGLFAQKGNADARSSYQKYQDNRTSYFKLIIVRAFFSVLFTYFISFWSLHGNASEYSVLFLIFMVIDYILDIAFAQKKEVFGQLLQTEFPKHFMIEVERMRPSQDPNEGASRVFIDPVGTALAFASGHLFSLYTTQSVLDIFAVALGMWFIHSGLAIGYFGVALLFLGILRRISSKTSRINRLGENKTHALNTWIRSALLRVQMGLPPATGAFYALVSSAGKRLIAEKMKYAIGLRALAVILLIAGAQMGLGLSTLVIILGLRSLFFLPDLAKEGSEGRPAEKSIRAFLKDHPGQPTLRALPNGAVINELELKNLSLSLRRAPNLIRNLTLRFSTGAVYLLHGPNGSGKTALLKYLAGWLLKAETSGQAKLHGKMPSGETFVLNIPEEAGHIHYFKPQPFPARMTIRAYMNQLVNEDQKRLFMSLVEATGPSLGDFDQVYVNEPSQGQQDRLKLALRLAETDANVPVLLLDETLAHMDPESKALWINPLKKYAQDTGRLIIMAEPDDVKNSDQLEGRFHLKNGIFFNRWIRKKSVPAHALATSA